MQSSFELQPTQRWLTRSQCGRAGDVQWTLVKQVCSLATHTASLEQKRDGQRKEERRTSDRQKH